MPLQKTSPGTPRGRARSLRARTVVIRLFDAYAGLLTARQRALARMYYHDDLSLGEIAARCRITRQAVSDALRRSVAELQRFEARLGLAAEHERAAQSRAETRARLAALEGEVARLAARDAADLAPLRRALLALRERL